MLKWIFRIVVALALIVVVAGVTFRDRIAQLLAVNSLFDEEVIVENFSRMPDLFYSTEIPAGATPSPLPRGAEIALPGGYGAFVEERGLTSLLVMKDGEIVHEAYFQGTDADDLRISWSMAKSYLSTLIGTAVDAGEIPSLEAPVTDYVPSLAGTAYADARIIDVLQMQSGAEFDERYKVFSSDINRMGRVLALGGSMDGFAEGITGSRRAPGERFKYVSIDTHVLGMVLRAATGQSVVDLMTSRLTGPLGIEADGAYITDGDGVAFVLGGLNFTTRDYARFGQMILDGGIWQGERIVSEDWISAATRPSARTAPGQIRYGYQWWIPADADITDPEHAYMGRGIYGQHLYVDPKAGVVIVQTAGDRDFDADGVFQTYLAFFRALVAAAERASAG
ncbi:MAG: serine hydrolase [Pseudomonadota bacterium]